MGRGVGGTSLFISVDENGLSSFAERGKKECLLQRCLAKFEGERCALSTVIFTSLAVSVTVARTIA